MFDHDHTTGIGTPFSGSLQIVAGILAGFVIGIVAAALGLAGSELLIQP
jgi:hypothetical protein